MTKEEVIIKNAPLIPEGHYTWFEPKRRVGMYETYIPVRSVKVVRNFDQNTIDYKLGEPK